MSTALDRLKKYNQNRILKAWMCIALANGPLTKEEKYILRLRCDTILLPHEWIEKLCEEPPSLDELDYTELTRPEISLTQSVGYALAASQGTEDPQKFRVYLELCAMLGIPEMRRTAMERSVRSLFLSEDFPVTEK